jgi:hypothetical protein
MLLGQWNITLSSATAYKRAKFVTVAGITNCSDTFGYVGSPSSYDWDSDTLKTGQITAGELKYLLSEYFNATYKLSSEQHDIDDDDMDLSNWYPFAGVRWGDYTDPVNPGIVEYDGNSWILRDIDWDDPRNTTFIIGDSAVHYDSLTNQGAATIDVVGAVMVGEAFGSLIGTWCDTDPVWMAMYDTQVFSKLSTVANTYTLTKPSLVYPDPVSVNLKLTGWQRMQGRWPNQDDLVTDIFTTPTCYTWDVNHTINIGGPRVNLGTAYFNDHAFIVWVDPATTGSELPEAGFYSIPTGTFYPESDGKYSLIEICEDLNLTSWTSVFDNVDMSGYGDYYDTNPNAVYDSLDGPTLNDPYAGLIVYGMGGDDTHAASYWLAHYWCRFNELYTNATDQPEYMSWSEGMRGKRGVTAVLLNTVKMCGVVDNDWQYAVQEMVGPVQGRWRAETGDNWGPWISYPCTIDWNSEVLPPVPKYCGPPV